MTSGQRRLKANEPDRAATPQPPPQRRAPGLTYSDNLRSPSLESGLLDRDGERRLGHTGKKLPVVSSPFPFRKRKDLRKDVPFYQTLKCKAPDADLPRARAAHPSEVRKKSTEKSKIAFIPPIE